MKNKIALASAFVAASSLATAEIVINDFLSFEGFIDMSYTYGDIDASGVPPIDGSDSTFGVDQVEIDWLFDFDPVTAQIDLAYIGSDAGGTNVNALQGTTASGDEVRDDVVTEQAFVTYSFEDGLAVTAGRFASMLGFEAFEPTGLYQYSFAYDMSILPGYSEGVKVTHETEDMFFGGAVLSDYSDYDFGRLGGSGDSNWAVEVAASFLFGDNDEFGWFVGGFYEDADVSGGDDGSTYTINTYITYETGAWIFAGELNYGNTETGAYDVDLDGGFFQITGGDDDDAMSGLIMANYAYSDAASVTARFSYESFEYNNAFDDEITQMKLTLAHGYAFTDNLSLITELSYVDGNIENNQGFDEDFDGILAAVELLFAF